MSPAPSLLHAGDRARYRVRGARADPRMIGWDPAATALLELLPRTGRGPRRDGIFALWLTVRVARDLRTGSPGLERAHRRRVAALAQRLSSLALPAPLRRALTAALADLQDPD